MDEYDCIKKSSLKFKGEKRKKKSKHSKSKAEPSNQSNEQDDRLKDAEFHGGWWKINKYDHIKEDVAIEFLPNCYARAMSNGNVVLGDTHPPGEGPDEEEIFTVISLGAGKIALKSGYGRYLDMDKRYQLVGLSEVVSEQQTFLVIFEDDSPALRAFGGCFLSLHDEENSRYIVGSDERMDLAIRVNHDPQSGSTEFKRFKNSH